MRSCALLLTASLVLASELLAKVWHVGPGGDFAQIQPAIDAAADDDIILVLDRDRKTRAFEGAYDPFVLNKGVTVRASGPSFKVIATTAHIGITGIAAGRKARECSALMSWFFASIAVAPGIAQVVFWTAPSPR